MKTYLELKEIDLLEKAATNLRDWLLIRVIFRLGCRVSGALGITVEDVDLENGTVTIHHLKALKLSCPQCNTRLGKTNTYCPRCGIKVAEAGHTSFNTTARYRKVAGEELKRWHDILWGKQGGGPNAPPSTKADKRIADD